MSCYICKKKSLKGNYRTFSNKANSRYFRINLQSLNLLHNYLFYENFCKKYNFFQQGDCFKKFACCLLNKDLRYKKQISLCISCLRKVKKNVWKKFNPWFFFQIFVIKNKINEGKFNKMYDKYLKNLNRQNLKQNIVK